jgi:hypothetical protein
MRGVPRERRAISAAPSPSQAMPRMRAERRDDPGQLLRRVELQPLHDAEAVAQRRGQQPARVVAPISVNGGRSSLIERAAGPSPIMMSIW